MGGCVDVVYIYLVINSQRTKSACVCVFVCVCVCVCVCVYQDLEDLELTDQERLLATLSYEALQELQV